MDVVFIPNSYVKTRKGEYAFLSHDIEFLDGITKACQKVVVACHTKEVENFENSKRIENTDKISIEAVPISASNGFFLSSLCLYIKTLVKLVRVALKSPRLVYIYYPGFIGFLMGVVCVVFRVPYGLYVRGDWEQSFLFRNFSVFLFRHAKFVIATGLEFSDKIGRVQSQVQPVVPMVNIDIGETAYRKSVRRQSGEEFRVLYVGRILKEKGLYDLLGAMKVLEEKSIPVRLEIAGMGSKENIDEMLRFINQNNLNGNVNYLGQLSDKNELSRIYRLSHALVLPSYYPEGFPRVIYEAMFANLPVVCTILPGMGGFMKAGVNCLEVKRENPCVIANALELLSGDECFRQELLSSGYDDVCRYFEGFSCESHADQVLEKIRC